MAEKKIKCAYCDSVVPGGLLTRDHVFVRALGATATAPACRKCNSSFGHSVEAKLLDHDQLLNLDRLVRGLGGKPVNGVLPDGQGVRYDFRSRELEMRRPVQRIGSHSIRITGSSRQLRTVLTKNGYSAAEVEELLLSAGEERLPTTRLDVGLVIDPILLSRLVAKIALGVGSSIWPEPVGESDVASKLRRIFHGDHTVYFPLGQEFRRDYIQNLIAIVKSINPSFAFSSPSHSENGNILIAHLGDSTVFSAVIGSVEWGIAVPGRLPMTMHLGMQVMDDGKGEFKTASLDGAVRKALSYAP